MITPEEKAHFLDLGYLHVRGVVTGEHLARLQPEFDRVWDLPGRSSQHKLLQHKSFLELIALPAILDRVRALFGDQAQLLQYDLLRQGPHNQTFPLRSWHRDFVFPGDTPLSVNTLLFLDPIGEAAGPTRVVPCSHRGTGFPDEDQSGWPHPEEVAVYAEPGDAIFKQRRLAHQRAQRGGRPAPGHLPLLRLLVAQTLRVRPGPPMAGLGRGGRPASDAAGRQEPRRRGPAPVFAVM